MSYQHYCKKIDVPADALLACRLCLEELHAVPAVKESFKIQLKKGFKSRFNKSERKEIITSVCRLNRAIYDVSQMVSDDTNLLLWPCIDIGEKKSTRCVTLELLKYCMCCTTMYHMLRCTNTLLSYYCTHLYTLHLCTPCTYLVIATY